MVHDANIVFNQSKSRIDFRHEVNIKKIKEQKPNVDQK